MKLKIKIRKFVRAFRVIALFLLVGNGVKAQCPKEIVPCDGGRGIGLKYDRVPSGFNFSNTYLDFGQGDSRNGYYMGDYYYGPTEPSPPTTIYYKVACTGGNLDNLKIRFNDANHTFCNMITEVHSDCSSYVKTFDFTKLDDIFATPAISNCKQWLGDCGLNGTLYRRGKVSIGTNSFLASFILGVSGKILTEQYKVQKCGSVWCDYVFDDTYKLMPLKEVKTFIEKNGHLPKTKSAAQITQEGSVEVGETLLMHQEKIEEAFLHLIDLAQQLNKTETEISKKN